MNHYCVYERAVQKRSPPPRILVHLWTALQDSGYELPLIYIHTLVESMPRPVAALLRYRGDPARYYAGEPVFLVLQCILLKEKVYKINIKKMERRKRDD